VQYLDADTGRVVFLADSAEPAPVVYRISWDSRVDGYPRAHLDTEH
jgi:hypothetical protein